MSEPAALHPDCSNQTRVLQSASGGQVGGSAWPSRAKERLTDTITDVVADQPISVDRWHLLSDMTVFYERRPSEFEEAHVLTATTLRDRPL